MRDETAKYSKDVRKKRNIYSRLENLSRLYNSVIFRLLMSPKKHCTDHEEKNQFWKLYKKDIDACAKVRVKTATVHVTNHAKYRFAERFKANWYTLFQLKMDLKKWRHTMKLLPSGDKLEVVWKLWTYIIAKKWLTIITMYPKKFLHSKR